MDPTRLSESRPDPFVGRTVDGYRIDELIGRGGMGEVYRATQLSLNRPVALKILPEALLEDQRFLDRFEREVDILSRLSHPGIVTVMERGEVDGRPYVVMEYVKGTSLREVMKRGPVPASEALMIVRGVLSALEHAHAQGIIHRDIKPENVLIAPGGVVKVADFGLSRIMEPDITRLTRSHVMLGTFEYMSPEQREQAKDADERSDLYATGVVLYEMIANELPIGHFDPLSKKRPKECDSRIDAIIERSLKKQPDDRYQEAASMGNAVSQLLSTAAAVEAPETVADVEHVAPAAPPPAAQRSRSSDQWRLYPLALAFIAVTYAIADEPSIAAITGAAVILALLTPWRMVRRNHVVIVGTLALMGVLGLFFTVKMTQRNARERAEASRKKSLDAMRAANRLVEVPVAQIRENQSLDRGFADELLRDRRVKDWLARLGRPTWQIPNGMSVKVVSGRVYLVFDRLVTKSGHHADVMINVVEQRVAVAFSALLEAQSDAVVRTALGDGPFEAMIQRDPPPKVDK